MRYSALGMELRQLATFAVVAEELSFSKAAGRLHVVQSAVSASVRKLEAELGADLFDRSGHRVALTEAGRALLPEAHATLAAATAARDAVDAVRGGVRGTVLLGVMQAPAMHPFDLPALLAGFRESHPGVSVLIRHAAGGSREMATQVRDGRIDLAFVSLPSAEMHGLDAIPLVRLQMKLAVAVDHPLAEHSTATLAEVAAETIVDFPDGWGGRSLNDRAFSAAGLTRTIAYEVNDATGLIGFVERGLAVGIVPESFAEGNEKLRLLPLRAYPEQFQIAIATSADRRLSAAAGALLAAVLDSIGRISTA